MSGCIFELWSVCVYACVRACVCACVHVCVHTYIRTYCRCVYIQSVCEMESVVMTASGNMT